MTDTPPARPTGNAMRDDVDAIAVLGDQTRRRLYDWVCAQGRPVGREAAAVAVGISRPLATFHLDRLAAAGLLETGYKRLSGRTGPGAGRPARVYWRSPRDFSVDLPSRNYELAAELFARALENAGERAAPDALRSAAHDMGERIAGASRRRGPGGQRGRLLSVLGYAGYEPEVDAAGTIRLRNCPFHALVESHRDLICGANLAMAEGIVHGARVEGCYARLDPQPGYCCVVFEPGEPGAGARPPSAGAADAGSSFGSG